MRSAAIISLAMCVTSMASAQELSQPAPLEMGRPSVQPLKIKKSPPLKKPAPPVADLAPPPVEPLEAPKTKKIVRVKKKPVVHANTAILPVKPTAPVIESAPPVVSKRHNPPVVSGGAMATPVLSGETTVQASSKGDFRKRALLNFRVANIWAVRNKTNTGSFIASWDPILLPWHRFNFGASLGVTAFESESVVGHGSESFLVYEYGLSTSYYVSRTFLPELVIGAQTWNEKVGGSTDLMIAANMNILYRKRLVGVLDRFYAGFGVLSTKSGNTNLLRVGVGVRF